MRRTPSSACRSTRKFRWASQEWEARSVFVPFGFILSTADSRGYRCEPAVEQQHHLQFLTLHSRQSQYRVMRDAVAEDGTGENV
jgi:hypothetical protein